MGNSSVNTKSLNYVEKHQGNAKYLFATSDSTTAAPYIIKTGKAVMAMGGFNGTDPAITLTQFKQLVKNGDLKYFYYSGRSGNTKIINWIKKHGTKVKTSLYQSANGTGTQSGMGGSTKTPAKPTSSNSGKTPNGAPTGKKRPNRQPGMKPSTKKNSQATAKQTTNRTAAKSTHRQATMQTPGGMGGSGVLYDLSSIYK